jgi:hypothetical protein
MFLLALMASMKPRKKASPSVQPKSAAAVGEHIRRIHTRDGHRLPPTPRVTALVKALEVRIAKTHGPGALLQEKKAPMTLDILLYARTTAAGRTIAGRVVVWTEPFWTCIWAAVMLLWYAGARKSDVLPTKATPFDRRRMSRAAISFHGRVPGAGRLPFCQRTAPRCAFKSLAQRRIRPASSTLTATLSWRTTATTAPPTARVPFGSSSRPARRTPPSSCATSP